MAKHKLIIREIDRQAFKAIGLGEKDIETRAATEKYKKVLGGDALIFVCGKDKLQKKVKKASWFKDIDSLVKKIDLRRIMPFASSVEDAKQIWYSFPRYKEKIKQYGLIAFELG